MIKFCRQWSQSFFYNFLYLELCLHNFEFDYDAWNTSIIILDWLTFFHQLSFKFSPKRLKFDCDYLFRSLKFLFSRCPMPLLSFWLLIFLKRWFWRWPLAGYRAGPSHVSSCFPCMYAMFLMQLHPPVIQSCLQPTPTSLVRWTESSFGDSNSRSFLPSNMSTIFCE